MANTTKWNHAILNQMSMDLDDDALTLRIWVYECHKLKIELCLGQPKAAY